MLDIKYIRENKELVKTACKNKGYVVDIEKLLKLDSARKKLLQEIETLRATQKKERDIAKAKKIKANIVKNETELNKILPEYEKVLYLVPNVPAVEAPIGKDDKENKVLKQIGKPKNFSFAPKEHFELGEALDLLDTARGVKIGGTRSYVLKGKMLELEQAVLRLALDITKKHGFTLMNVPVIVNKEVLVGSGFFPFGAEDVYEISENKYLVGTSEASLVYYHAKEVLNEKELPKQLAAITTCFRKEAGTYGKDTKGIVRVHQFNKVETVVLCKPEEGRAWFEKMFKMAEEIVKALELPYQIVDICTGDMGAKNKKQYDIEVWFAGQGKYRESHSCSWLGDYQGRRANIRYNDKQGNKIFVHTLNNTAIATPRILGAILEYNQQKDGSITIPKALQKYTDFVKINSK